MIQSSPDTDIDHHDNHVSIHKTGNDVQNIINEPQGSNCQEPFLNPNQSPSQQANSKATTVPSPPDGGYGWFIVLGSFMTHVIIGTLERSEGLFFLNFQAKYKQSAQLTAWPGAIASIIRLMFGSVAGAFSNRYSVRTCNFCGGLIVFLALLFTSLAPNFYFLFLSHGVMQGLGLGLIYAPCLIIVGMYFNKKRGVATGLATSGVGFGSFIFVPIVQLLFDTYGMSGSFLILSAFSLHTALIAMLHRPLSLHYKFTGVTKSPGMQLEHKNLDEENSFLPTAYINTAAPVVSADVGRNGSKMDLPAKNSKKGLHQSKNSGCKDCIKSSLQICFPKEDSRFVKQTRKKIYHFYLLKNLPFLLFCCTVMMYTASNKSCLTFIPALIKSKGFSDTEAALIISILGGFDSIGRMGIGAIFDTSYLRPHRPLFYNFFLAIVASTGFIFPSIDNYAGLCIIAAVYGLFAGAFISQKSVIIVDILGEQHMSSSFGMLILFQGVGAGVGPPLSGLFRDVFGSFTQVFYLGGGMLTVGVSVMILSNIFLRRQRQKTEKSEENQ